MNFFNYIYAKYLYFCTATPGLYYISWVSLFRLDTCMGHPFIQHPSYALPPSVCFFFLLTISRLLSRKCVKTKHFIFFVLKSWSYKVGEYAFWIWVYFEFSMQFFPPKFGLPTLAICRYEYEGGGILLSQSCKCLQKFWYFDKNNVSTPSVHHVIKSLVSRLKSQIW